MLKKVLFCGVGLSGVMYSFAIDMGEESSYSLAVPQGANVARKIFEN